MEMRLISVLAIAVSLTVPTVVMAGIYQWRDDSGVMQVTDNPDRIPARFRSRVKDYSAADGAPKGKSGAELVAQKAAPQPAPPVSAPLTGDRAGGDRKVESERLRQELKTLEEGVPAKKKELDRLHHKWSVSKGRNPTEDEKTEFEKNRAKGAVAVGDNPYVNKNALGTSGAKREAYYKKLDEIRQDTERIARLRQEIDALEREADRGQSVGSGPAERGRDDSSAR